MNALVTAVVATFYGSGSGTGRQYEKAAGTFAVQLRRNGAERWYCRVAIPEQRAW